MTIGSPPTSRPSAKNDALSEIGRHLQATHGFITELAAGWLHVIRSGAGVVARVTVSGSKIYVFGDLYLGRTDDPSNAAARRPGCHAGRDHRLPAATVMRLNGYPARGEASSTTLTMSRRAPLRTKAGKHLSALQVAMQATRHADPL
ncbi:hypothetical protein GCM10023191_065040 [Actinoallomurus oryzae]|uniref:Uncharacterized protein n=1 Tax=Actinoallomurus oryzae TaxID=502180 RepID=A0ABP8QQH6_9ACTN